MSEKSGNVMTLTLPSPTEIVTARAFDAPRELVFEAWTRPEHVREWWGQTGSTMPVCEIDLRPGGRWRYVEHAADGKDYPFTGEYREVTPPERLVHTFVFDVPPFNERAVVSTVTFEAQGAGRTLVTETMVFETQDDRDGIVQSGMESGAIESMDRLEALLRKLV